MSTSTNVPIRLALLGVDAQTLAIALAATDSRLFDLVGVCEVESCPDQNVAAEFATQFPRLARIDAWESLLTEQHDNRPAAPARPEAVAATAFANLRPTLAPEPPMKFKPLRDPTPERLIFEHPIVPGRSAFAAEEGPAFQALFRNGAQSSTALSPAVRALWGEGDPLPRRLAAVVPDTNLSPPGAVGEPLNLLDHMKPSIARTGRRTRI